VRAGASSRARRARPDSSSTAAWWSRAFRKEGELVPVSWGEALAAAAAGLSAAKSAGGAGAVAVIGGARLTNEAAYAWAKLAKGVIGTDSVDAQLGDGLPAELVLGLPRATIDEACAAPVLVTLTGDLREELPVLFLRLREAVVGGGTQLLEIAAEPTALTNLATASLRIRRATRRSWPAPSPVTPRPPPRWARIPKGRRSRRTSSSRPARCWLPAPTARAS